MTGSSAPAADARGGGRADVRGTPWQRIRARALIAAAWVVGRLPERPLLRLADLGGRVAYRLQPGRRAQARRNLARVAVWAAEQGAGPDGLRAAAADPVALERLVEAAFRHHARYWVELIRAPRMSAAYIGERVRIETPEVLDAALAPGGAVVFVGLHYGAIELPAFYLGQVIGRGAIGPMEAVDDPELRRWFLETRATMGVRIVGLREARRELTAAVRDGAAIGIVADRDLTGGGIELSFFGHPAPLPAGPALLVLEDDVPTYAIAVRRTGLGRYAARLEAIPLPPAGPRRARVEAFLTAEARAFERLVVLAAEQWWGCFHPIWPDLAPEPRR